MTKTLGEVVVDVVNDPCQPDDVRTIDYSGRAMLGHRCLGIVGPYASCMRVIAASIRRRHGEVVDFVRGHFLEDEVDDNDYADLDQRERTFETDTTILLGFNVDQLGKSDVVVYWPGIAPPASVVAP